MRGLIGAALITLLAAPGAAAAATPWSPDVQAATSYARDRAGQISFAVRMEGRLRGLDVTRAVPSASVLKAMLLVTYLRRPDVRGRALAKRDVALLEPMVRWSDSIAATRVRDIVGNAGLRRLARATGMKRFAPAAMWGMSSVDAADQTRFFLHLEGGWGSGTGAVDHQVALLRRGSRRFALAIMTTNSPGHAYGKETLRGVAARVLRGLGPDSDPR